MLFCINVLSPLGGSIDSTVVRSSMIMPTHVAKLVQPSDGPHRIVTLTRPKFGTEIQSTGDPGLVAGTRRPAVL